MWNRIWLFRIMEQTNSNGLLGCFKHWMLCLLSNFHLFIWRPTIKRFRNRSTYKNMSVGACSSPRLSLCRGVLPWDLTGTPVIPGISSSLDLDAVMPYFDMISSTGCSPRIRQFLCSLLEPECRNVGNNILPPCRKSCRGMTTMF